jgi:hypothetical protein
VWSPTPKSSPETVKDARVVAPDTIIEANVHAPAAKTPQAKAAVNKAAADKLAAAQAPLKQLNVNIDIEVQKNIDISIDALEKSYLALKDKTDRSKRDNNLLNNCARYLANLYEVKRNKFRGKDPQKFDMYEAKYKEFDALQNSFGN